LGLAKDEGEQYPSGFGLLEDLIEIGSEGEDEVLGFGDGDP